MTPCIFCRQPVDDKADDWHGHPCHVQCAYSIRKAVAEFEPVSKVGLIAGRKPVVYGWVGVTFQSYRMDWESINEKGKAVRWNDYVKVLEEVLNYQEKAVRAYCIANQLPSPTITRELKQVHKSLKELNRIINIAKPGDHIVITQAYRAGSDGPSLHTFRMAKKLAAKGVTLHVAYSGCSWGNPISQMIMRSMAANSRWHNDTRTVKDAYFEGRAKVLWRLPIDWIKKHMVFAWVVKNIRDKKMSPMELAHAAGDYWCVNCYIMGKTRQVTVMITRSMAAAREERNQDHFECIKCRVIGKSRQCSRCRERAIRRAAWLVKGVNFTQRWAHMKREIDKQLKEPEEKSEEIYMKLWALYCQDNPKQEPQPWLNRGDVDWHDE